MVSVRTGRALSKTTLMGSEVVATRSWTSMIQTPSSVNAESAEIVKGGVLRSALMLLLSPENGAISSW